MSFGAWLSELNRVLVVFVPCVVLGLAIGHLQEFIMTGLVVYGVWTVAQMATLKQWLEGGARTDDAPE